MKNKHEQSPNLRASENYNPMAKTACSLSNPLTKKQPPQNERPTTREKGTRQPTFTQTSYHHLAYQSLTSGSRFPPQPCGSHLSITEGVTAHTPPPRVSVSDPHLHPPPFPYPLTDTRATVHTTTPRAHQSVPQGNLTALTPAPVSPSPIPPKPNLIPLPRNKATRS